MRKKLSLCVAALALSWLALPPSGANAVPVDVTYSIIVNVNIPSHGVSPAYSGPGIAIFQFQSGTAGGHVSPGPIHFLFGSAMATGTFFIGSNFFSGSFFATAPGSGLGTATPGGGFSLNTIGHIVSGFAHCTGPNCFTLGYTASVNKPLASATGAFFGQVGQLFGFPSGGPSSFTITGTAATFAGTPITVFVTGQEISRTVVPEPGTGLLVGLGLVGLGVGGSLARLRRRQP